MTSIVLTCRGAAKTTKNRLEEIFISTERLALLVELVVIKLYILRRSDHLFVMSSKDIRQV
jgi:hypothetical protein